MSTARVLEIHKLMAGLVFVAGLMLMAGKIHFDGEPGLIPMVLVLLGAGWFLIARARIRSRRK